MPKEEFRRLRTAMRATRPQLRKLLKKFDQNFLPTGNTGDIESSLHTSYIITHPRQKKKTKKKILFKFFQKVLLFFLIFIIILSDYEKDDKKA